MRVALLPVDLEFGELDDDRLVRIELIAGEIEVNVEAMRRLLPDACYGGARPPDRNFATVHCVDSEIVEWLQQRERRRRRRAVKETDRWKQLLR
jgi:hypothetical protein